MSSLSWKMESREQRWHSHQHITLQSQTLLWQAQEMTAESVQSQKVFLNFLPAVFTTELLKV